MTTEEFCVEWIASNAELGNGMVGTGPYGSFEEVLKEEDMGGRVSGSMDFRPPCLKLWAAEGGHI